jgi:hypothetical protein
LPTPLRNNGVALLLFAVACGLPRDPDDTLERVRGGVVRVGITDNPPWAIVTPVVPNDDADLVRRIEKASEHLRKQDWRLYSLVVVPVSHIDGETPVSIG